ncbi:histidine kinase [Algoriphagus pacificus]|uniref:Histidine kinase n=1 Tax=Algoriphagus pacificus TaxID=2811234 RepID=A0ABS3CMN5_9BACT|nr:histidine kinase [Algoriphagus pacificus]MBN7816909.1 histidine kinase [Algoriphagus pacificus]
MKSIRLYDRIQKSITNSSMYSFNSMLDRIFKYPDLVLVVVWGGYALLDFFSVMILDVPMDLPYALANLFFGFAFSWLLYYFLLPYMLLQRNWRKGILYLVGMVLFITGLKFLIIFSGRGSSISFSMIWLEFLRLFQFQGLTFFLWGLLAYYILLKDSKQKKHQLDELELQHNSMQLGPHFVLNMLNGISVKAKDCSGDLSQDIEQFSLVLKYSYKDLESENSLMEELAAIQAFAFCQEQRFGDSLNVSNRFQVNEKLASELPLPKMLLLTLYIDVYKHGDYQNKQVPCQIGFRLDESREDGRILFTLTIHNLNRKNYSAEESGFGIKTVKKVLDYYFEEDYQLFYTLTDREFSLMLMIDYGY